MGLSQEGLEQQRAALVSKACRGSRIPAIEASFPFLHRAEKLQKGPFLEANILIYPETQEGCMLDLPMEEEEAVSHFN